VVLIRLFFTLFYVNAFTIGGGYVMLPILHKEVVERWGWLTDKEFTEAIAIGQITPGPLTIMNAFIGYKIQGVLGSITAVLGSYLPSLIIVILVSRYYLKFKESWVVDSALKGIKPAVIGMLAAVTIKLGTSALIDTPTSLIALGTFALLIFTKIDPTFIILGSGILGAFLY